EVALRFNKVDESLPIASLRLLAPPMRLVSAAVWKVMQQRDVMQYGKLEEFVTSVSESVPGLLSYRHQAKLTVGLRAQFILQQLRVSSSPDPDLIVPHLERLRRKIQKVELAVKNFHTLVHTLLKNPERRKQFFQEEFDSQYGPQYDLAVEKLLWEFLTRLDQLLPVPDLAQTVSWLSSAPAVLEECARSASQPQLLSTLLQHEKCLGHLDSAGKQGHKVNCSAVHATRDCDGLECNHSSNVFWHPQPTMNRILQINNVDVFKTQYLRKLNEL
uniref:TERF1 (TRF1)-interacting nuclear factor 2 n=1 Tax=Astyanax mexicanus TaxID=7994 RepID=A0A3B1JT87_ASTMX